MDRARNLSSFAVLALIGMVAFGRTKGSPGNDDIVASFVTSFLMLAAVFWLSVLSHEMGHAGAARLVGLEPYVMLAGGGPKLLRRRFAGMALDLRWLPGSGLTIFASGPTNHIRWKLLAAYAGGPLATLLLFFAGILSFGSEDDLFVARHPVFSLAEALALINGLVLFSVIVPLPRRSDVTTPRNDFLQILGLPWLRKEHIDAVMSAALGAEFTRLAVLRDYEAAADEARRILDAHPENWVVRLGLAELLVFAGFYAEAQEHYRALLEGGLLPDGACPPAVRAMSANNFAWSLFMLSDPSVIDAAETWSKEAQRALPKHPSIVGTRGAILVETGRVAEGEELLGRAHRMHRDRFSRASTLACLAVAAARRGDRGEAERLLDRARRLDDECDALMRAERVLAPAHVKNK